MRVTAPGLIRRVFACIVPPRSATLTLLALLLFLIAIWQTTSVAPVRELTKRIGSSMLATPSPSGLTLLQSLPVVDVEDTSNTLKSTSKAQLLHTQDVRSTRC